MEHITSEMNKHNCQLCTHEFLGRCLGANYGKDVSLDNEPCEYYKFGGSEEKLKLIEGDNAENYIREHCKHNGLFKGDLLYEKSKSNNSYKFSPIICKYCPFCGQKLSENNIKIYLQDLFGEEEN